MTIPPRADHTVDVKGAWAVRGPGLYRTILPDGEIRGDRYHEGEHGVDLFDATDEHLGVVPYDNLIDIPDEEMTGEEDEQSFM